MKNKTVFLVIVSAILILPVKLKAEDPTATASPMDVIGGGTSYSFNVVYTDDGEVDRYSLNDGDVRVTGPDGFDVAAAFVTASSDVPAPLIVATYSITPPGGSWDSSDNGTYQVVMQANQVFDGIGNAVKPGTIGSFNVTSTAPPPTPRPQSQAQLLNISTRLKVQTGDNVLIGGFIVAGNDPKKVILRAVGPSLTPLGVTGALADPVLELHGSGGALMTSNDNWKDTQETDIEASGFAPLSELESAIIATLDPGAYTAIVSGKDGTSGVGLVEGYDVDEAADSQLGNISTRGLVESGDNVMIGGFILGNGEGTTNVLIRAVGPSLTPLGVSGAMADPTLELHSADGVLVMSNDNWKETQEAEIEATGLAPTNDLESAILVTLPTAAYTAIVEGKVDTTGVALVEAYRLP